MLATDAHRQSQLAHFARVYAGRKDATHPCAILVPADRAGATQFSHTPVMLPAGAVT